MGLLWTASTDPDVAGRSGEGGAKGRRVGTEIAIEKIKSEADDCAFDPQSDKITLYFDYD